MENPLYRGEGQFTRYSGLPGVRGTEEPGRGAFSKDFARLVHAPAFRRLQGKTQLFPGGESDFFRNRLTHSLEVAQIARGIATRLNATEMPRVFEGGEIDEDLVEFAAIAHDLGHPPFGHNGEHALDELMREHGGFEGNAQTLRILAAVERKLVTTGTAKEPQALFGLDLTYRSLASVIKYDEMIKPVRSRRAAITKGYYASEAALVREIKTRVAPNLHRSEKFKTIECAIMDIADDIAYSTYDLEDSFHAGFVTPLSLANSLAINSAIQAEVLLKTNRALTEAGYKIVSEIKELNSVVDAVFGGAFLRNSKKAKGENAKEALSQGIRAWMADKTLAFDSLARTQFTAERVGRLIAAVELVPNKKYPQLSGVKMKRAELLQVEVLKHLTFEVVIRSPILGVVEHRGKDIVARIFNALVKSDGAFLADDWKDRYSVAVGAGVSEGRRVLCDYVACMTDRYAAELHSRLFGEGSTIFKPL